MSPPSFCEPVGVSVLPTSGAEDLVCNTPCLQHPLPTFTLITVAETLRMFVLCWAAQIEESIVLKFAASLLKYLYLKPNLKTFYGPFVVIVQTRSLPEWLQSSRLHSRALCHTHRSGNLFLYAEYQKLVWIICSLFHPLDPIFDFFFFLHCSFSPTQSDFLRSTHRLKLDLVGFSFLGSPCLCLPGEASGPTSGATQTHTLSHTTLLVGRFIKP